MTKIAILSLSLSLAACAAGAHPGTAPARQQAFDAVSAEQTRAAFPVAIAPRLPSVDRISRQVHGELGDRASADVELCVGNDGKVAKITVVRGSAYAAFDAAVVRDVADWQFVPLPGPASLRTCAQKTIAYQAP
jgi:TonB family protein